MPGHIKLTAAQCKAIWGKAAPKPRKVPRIAQKRKTPPRLIPDTHPPLELILPWPPTINTYWRSVSGRNILSKKGRQYREVVLELLARETRECRIGLLKATMIFNPPDRRRRDLDNLPKGALDALKHGGVYTDDSLIRHIDMRFGEVKEKGRVCITLSPFVPVPD